MIEYVNYNDIYGWLALHPLDSNHQLALNFLFDCCKRGKKTILTCSECKYFNGHQCTHEDGLVAPTPDAFCSYAKLKGDTNGN